MQTLPKSRAARLCFLLALFLINSFGQVNILTNRYNQSRTAANLNETILNISNVNTSTFGKLGTYTVDGVIYAQPLYVQGVTVNGATHNVLYIATMHDVLYAFDADIVGSLPLWMIDFRNLAAGIVPAPVKYGVGDGSNAAVADTFGIFGTPVIDLPNNRMFFVTHTFESGIECFRLRSVDIRSGALLASTLITGTVPAVGTAPSVSIVNSQYGQRGALELVNGQVFVPLGSRPTGDVLKPFYGWLMTYNANTLAQTGVFATSRTTGNSIFQMGSGPAVDASGNVYYLTGNGGPYDGVTEFPESLLRFNFGSTLTINNWYTPDNSSGNNDYAFMNLYDLDLGCNGPVLIQGTDLITFGSKTADVYLLHTGNLGQLTPNDTQVAQFFHVGAQHDYTNDLADRIVGMAYWAGPSGGTLYVWPGQDTLHAYSLNAATSNYTQTYAGTFFLGGEPATALAVSANGSDPSTGILWAPMVDSAAPTNTVGEPGVLHAYNASNPAQELWNSDMVSSDKMGTEAKFVPVVVVNGKVYVANSAAVNEYGAGTLTVYGLKPNITPHVSPYVTMLSPANGTVVAAGTTVNISASIYPAPGNHITSVSIMDGTTVLTTVNTGAQGTYNYSWTAAGVGGHTLTAVAIDQAGGVTSGFAPTMTVVASPTVSMSASPASVVVRPGSIATTQISVTPLNGFSGTFSVKDFTYVPGITAVIAPGSSNNTFVLTITASASASPSTSNQVINVSGNGATLGSFVVPLNISQTAAFTPGSNSLSFSVPNGATLGTPIVFTEGVPSASLPSPDYSLVSTNCTGSVTGTCNVSIQFTPQFSGLRRGAVELMSSSNTILSTAYFYGNGTQSVSQSAWAVGTLNTIYKNGSAHGVTVDGAGDVFLVDSWANQVFKIVPGGGPTAVTLGQSLSSPFGLALDAAGNLYVADSGNNRILELPYGGSAATALNVTGLTFPEGVAVDGMGNLFIANTRGAATGGNGTVIELPAGSGAQATVLGTGLSFPSSVAVDAPGDLFIADWGNNRVLELPAGGSLLSLGAGLSNPSAVAVDGLGDLFITDENNNRLVELPAGAGAQVTVASGLVNPYGLAVDAKGNLYIVNAGNATTAGGVVELLNSSAITTQAIVFGSIPSQAAGSSITLSAAASSGLSVVYTSLTTSVCTISGGNAMLLTPGTCTIVASQPGNGTITAAASVSQSFTVTGQAQVVVVALTVPAGVTLGTPVVFTEGAPSSSITNPDFTLLTSNCAGATTATCTVNVKFTPQFVGLRRGAVKLVNSSNVVVSTFYFYGNGTGIVSQPAWSAGTRSNIYTNGSAHGVAVDGAGNVFVLDSWTNQVYKIAPGGSPVLVPLGLTLSSPFGIALDAAGNLFIADAGNNRIVELPYGTSTATALNISGLTFPEGVAVDGLGDLFIANSRGTASSGNGSIIEATPGFTAQSTVLASGLSYPSGVAIDAYGNLFIADWGNNRVLELPMSGATPVSIGTGLANAGAVAVDGLGDVFIADENHNQLVELPGTASGPGTGTQITVGTGLVNPYGLVLNGRGDVFIVNTGTATAAGGVISILN